MKKIPILLILMGLTGFFIFSPQYAHAQTDNYTANITTDSSSDVLINGQGTNEDYVANGDTVNVTFNNTSSSNIIVCTKTLSPTSIGSGSSATVAVTVNGEAEMDVYLSSGNCTNGSGNSGYLYIEGAIGSLSCSLTNNQVWNVTGQYSYVRQSLYLYRGGTYVADIQASHGGGGYYFSSSVNEEFSAQTTSSTYYLYDGTSNSDELIGQTTCPAATKPAPTPAPSNPTAQSTPPAPTTSPTHSQSTATETTSPQKATNTKAVPPTSPVTSKPTRKVSSRNADLYISVGTVVTVVVALVFLNVMKIWTAPKKLLLRLWRLSPKP